MTLLFANFFIPKLEIPNCTCLWIFFVSQNFSMNDADQVILMREILARKHGKLNFLNKGGRGKHCFVFWIGFYLIV